jgi:hypothetical protein
MDLTYEMSLENYADFYYTIRDELKIKNIFGVVSELNILDQCLDENLISEEFHRLNVPRCVKVDKMNINKELFHSMFISSLLISLIYYIFIPKNSYPFFKLVMYIYFAVVYYLSYKYYKAIS